MRVLASHTRPVRLVSPRGTSRIIMRCYIYFNKPLMPSPLACSDWFVRTLNIRRNLSNCLARVDRVQLDTQFGAWRFGPNIVTYTRGSIFLRDEDGLIVESFSDFPVIMT